MKKKLLFRADGNSDIGLGHLYRLFALVEMYKDTYDFIFVTKKSTALGIIPKNYATQLIPNEINSKDEPKWLSHNFNSKEYIIIADGYQFVSNYQKIIKELGYQLMYIDDLTTEFMYADIVVNHSPNTKESDYQSEDYTKFALGTDYAILRPLFLKVASQSRKIDKINTVFVCFGGSDMYNLSLLATEALLEIDNFKQIFVVLGVAYKHKKIFELKKKHSKITIIQNASEEKMLHTMQQCNFAIAPASTILYELSCVKMPILSGYYVDNQKNIYKQLFMLQTIYNGGNFKNYTKVNFKEKLKTIIDNNNFLTQLKQQQLYFKGNSKRYLLGKINALNLSFIKANKSHLIQVFNWSNDNLVRKNSYQSQPILLENHSKWFNQKMKNENTLFLIAIINNNPGGVVRFEIENTNAVIGILIDPKYRGQRLAIPFLIETAKIYFKTYKKPIFATIKNSNIASIKSFKSAGYHYYKSIVIKTQKSSIYKLNKTDVIK
ncbi:MAG: UDP-2,4-diacetamido-2,4,6-trideoxy-beta-L-altropyranose hydrolase [Flavobacteriaceae bacterium]|nr:UDP-2,4-diacetamido-2,4,6-trideoxy-beta-L-altropyranose hydrolase [Flavobacteriaceae bacterium]